MSNNIERLIVRDLCESEPYNHNADDAVCVSVGYLEEVLSRRLAAIQAQRAQAEQTKQEILEAFEAEHSISMGVEFLGGRYVAKEPYICGSDDAAINLNQQYATFKRGFLAGRSNK